MRTKNSFLNMVGVLLVYVTKMLMVFLGKTYLIKVLGDEYNGISGLFTNVISMLSIAELGIGSAIIYHLYRPVKENDRESIRSIMAFYKKCYHVIAGVVLGVGIFLMPIVPFVTGNLSVKENIYLLYFLFLFDSAVSYLFSYKRSILYAYQKNYIISICDVGYTVVLQMSQILILIYTKNYVLYLLVGVICRIAENVLISYLADKKYPFLKEKNAMPMKQEIKKDIKEKVKGLLFHKISTYVVLGTDNIIISKMVSVVAVGLYSNYYIVINALSSILNQLITAAQASVGDLLVEEDCANNYRIYKKLEVINFWVYTVASVCLFYLIQDFIVLWLGDRYMFPEMVVFIIVLNFWCQGMRSVLQMFKTATGIFYEDRFVPLVEATINLLASVILAYYFGILGVLLGTFISSLCLFLYSYPVFVYKPVLGQKTSVYIKEQGIFVLQWIGILAVSGMAEKIFESLQLFSNGYIAFIIKGVFMFCVVNFCLFLLYRKSDEYQSIRGIIIGMCRKLGKHR